MPTQAMPQRGFFTESDMKNIQSAYEQAARDREQQIFQQTSAFGKTDDENLVKWQLELDNILERIDHLLRGHKLTWKEGNLIWVEPKDKNEAIFNDYGVNEILRILSLYLNRNTILSNYAGEMIETKVYDFGNEVGDLILGKYEEMGLDTYEKMILYPMIIRELVDVIHSAYLRALHGGERESLREARSVTQTMPLGQGIGMNFEGIRSTRGVLNPFRYILGKYK